MNDDDDLLAEYQARGVPTEEWQDLTPQSMTPAFRLLYKALPSPFAKAPGSDEAEHLIHNPVEALRDAGVLGDGDTPRISTMVVNHEKTLERFITHFMVVVSTNPSTVGITIAKEEKPKPNPAE